MREPGRTLQPRVAKSASRALCEPTPPRPKLRLLDQVRHVVRLRHFSPRTEEAYVHWVKRFVLHHRKRHPAEMRAPEIREFLSSLAVERKVSAST